MRQKFRRVGNTSDLMLAMGPDAEHQHHLHRSHPGAGRGLTAVRRQGATPAAPLQHRVRRNHLHHVAAVGEVGAQVHQRLADATLGNAVQHVALIAAGAGSTPAAVQVVDAGRGGRNERRYVHEHGRQQHCVAPPPPLLPPWR